MLVRERERGEQRVCVRERERTALGLNENEWKGGVNGAAWNGVKWERNGGKNRGEISNERGSKEEGEKGEETGTRVGVKRCWKLRHRRGVELSFRGGPFCPLQLFILDVRVPVDFYPIPSHFLRMLWMTRIAVIPALTHLSSMGKEMRHDRKVENGKQKTFVFRVLEFLQWNSSVKQMLFQAASS